jgi:NTP pyrophosphatase (non-canonical NTP hydrolase)
LKKNANEDVEIMHNFIATTEFFSVLIEEVGEVARALQGEGDLAEELTHVAASCVRWLENLT